MIWTNHSPISPSLYYRMPYPIDSVTDFPYSESNSLCVPSISTRNDSKLLQTQDSAGELFENIGRVWPYEVKKIVPGMELVLRQLKSDIVDSAAASSQVLFQFLPSPCSTLHLKSRITPVCQTLMSLRQNTALAQRRASKVVHSISSGVRSGLERAYHNLDFVSKYNTTSKCFHGDRNESSNEECHGLAAGLLHSLQSLHFSLDSVSRIYKGPHFQNLWGILSKVWKRQEDFFLQLGIYCIKVSMEAG